MADENNAKMHIKKIKTLRKIQFLIAACYIGPAMISRKLAYNFGLIVFILMTFFAMHIYISSLLYCPYCGEKFSKSLKSADVPAVCPHCRKSLKG